jgi:putative PIN family toxin of toxin-antitoxin system
MRRVVLDTNVLVASLLQPAGLCGRLLDLLVDGAAEVCLDDRLLAEYTDMLSRRKLHLPPEKVQTLLEFFRQSGIPVIAHPLAVTLPDPDDLAFLEVAASGEALLVTGNQRHFPKAATGAVSVLSPAGCLEALRKHA